MLQPPQPENVEIRLLEEFYRSQYVVSSTIGLLVGLGFGWLATRRIRHKPEDRGADFNSRVMNWGMASAAVATLTAGFTAATMASLSPFDPFAPTERVMLVIGSGLFVVILAFAFATALLAFAAYSRFPQWGGRYAILRRI